ncbi:cytochrome P450 [Reyranella sp.]|uniref:cytochrome P450 n=1 Tax=Reyranella sp. TaxID=1929291 RepID=UPI0037836D63
MNDFSPSAADQATLAFNPLDPAFIADPYPYYRRLRETAPVYKTAQGFWLATGYEDVALILRDKRFGKDFVGNMRRRYGEKAGLDEPAIANLARTMLVLDPPDHTRLRGLVNKAFTARRVADMRPRIKALVEEQLDRVIDKGGMDVMRDLAHRLPVIVICDMLGIPEEHRAPFLAGSNVNGRIIDPVPLTREELDQANRNTQMAGVYFKQLCELRRREPRDDLTTELVRAEEAGDKLTSEELDANIGLLFGAGHETTTNLIGNGLLALHRQPDQWERLKADPALIPNAVEELLRYDSSVQLTGRVTNTEVELSGVRLGPSESIIALLGAANRDPAQYPDPDRLDVGRQHVRPMSFGGGIHHCLGAQLARLEAELVFTALIERIPNIRLPEKDAPAWRHTFTLRGLSKLPAVWH